MKREKKDSVIAAAITFTAALLILLLLFTGALSYDRAEEAESSTAALMMPDPDEELFIEPEMVQDLGEPDAKSADAPAPAIQGEPVPDVKDNIKKTEPGKNPKPAPPREKPVSQTKPSPVKQTEPSVSDEERNRVKSSMAGKFSGKDGARDGKNGSAGAGGTGVGMHGVASGRTFISCPKPSVQLRHKVVVTVDVTIDASGHVTSARARGGADASIKRACEQAASSARWSEKKDVPSAKGTITFTITPR